jgi:hypothetical protein
MRRELLKRGSPSGHENLLQQRTSTSVLTRIRFWRGTGEYEHAHAAAKVRPHRPLPGGREENVFYQPADPDDLVRLTGSTGAVDLERVEGIPRHVSSCKGAMGIAGGYLA